MANPVQHQTQQPMPKLDSKFVDERGIIQISWFRLLLTLWTKSGAGDAPNPFAVVFEAQDDVGTLPLNIFQATTGEFLGTVRSPTVPGQPAEPLNPNLNPFVFQAPREGLIYVTGGELEYSRDGQTWYLISLTTGNIQVQCLDFVRVTWTGPLPTVVFFPVG